MWNAEQRAHWLLIHKNQSAATFDVIMSDWVWFIGLRHLEFNARSLDMYVSPIYLASLFRKKHRSVFYCGVYTFQTQFLFFCKLKISVPLIWFLPSMLVVHLFERQKVTSCVVTSWLVWLSYQCTDNGPIMPCSDGLQRPQRMPSEIRREPWEICKHTLDSCIKALLSICVSKQQFQVKLARSLTHNLT